MARKIGVNKSKVGFSVDRDTYAEFEKYCDDNDINKSKLVERMLRKFLEEKSKIIEKEII